MAEWVKAPEQQLALQRWMTSQQGYQWRRSWVYHERQEEPAKADLYDAMWLVEGEKLLTAHAIWVAPEMTDLIEAARDGFKPEPMESQDFMVHTGFVFFEKPVMTLDRAKNRIPIGAISWCPLTFSGEPRDDVAAQAKLQDMTQQGTGVVTHDPDLAGKPDVEGISLALFQVARDNYPALVPMHFTYVVFGDPLDEGHLLDPEGRPTGANQWWKTVQTSLRLMQQRLAVKSDAAIDRPTRRRWKRETKHEPKEMMVIRLRRPETKSGEPVGKEVEWSHRWIVGGFWRNQPYGPGNKLRRQVYINDYIKGPEDKPFIPKRRYYKWDR